VDGENLSTARASAKYVGSNETAFLALDAHVVVVVVDDNGDDDDEENIRVPVVVIGIGIVFFGETTTRLDDDSLTKQTGLVDDDLLQLLMKAGKILDFISYN
jgi:hypothetical protein